MIARTHQTERTASHVYACMRARACANVFVCACECLRVCACVRECARASVCVREYARVHVYVALNVEHVRVRHAGAVGPGFPFKENLVHSAPLVFVHHVVMQPAVSSLCVITQQAVAVDPIRASHGSACMKFGLLIRVVPSAPRACVTVVLGEHLHTDIFHVFGKQRNSMERADVVRQKKTQTQATQANKQVKTARQTKNRKSAQTLIKATANTGQ